LVEILNTKNLPAAELDRSKPPKVVLLMKATPMHEPFASNIIASISHQAAFARGHLATATFFIE
jgi:hypothetical protein